MRPAHLVCSLAESHRFEAERPATTCPHDGAPLLVRYSRIALERELLAARPQSMWRYREALPLEEGEEPVTLGEGGTALILADRLRGDLRLDVPLYVKDESTNPASSFKARGMSVAVTRARGFGFKELVAPSAGNAGLALAAYGARAGIGVTVFLPRDTPPTLIEGCAGYGARVELVEGLIDEAGKRAAEYAQTSDVFNLATLREPYRVEGKKTMAYELVEALGAVPAAIVYPTGGGTGLIGMWKAFDELQACGWIGAERPRLIAVQADGCAPIVRAFATGAARAERWHDAVTAAYGLRVPAGVGDVLVLRALRESNGSALSVSERAMAEDMLALRRLEGIDAGEEGGAALAGLRALVAAGQPFEGPIVLFNTGSALTYAPRGGNRA